MGAAVSLRVRGQVQGVGFRPFVWQVAYQLGLSGEVLNDAEGVLIRLAPVDRLDAFMAQFWARLPPLARVDEVESTSERCDQPLPFPFTITQSQAGRANTSVAPDARICDACASELRAPADRRFGYPFINCTHCGPRFTIIESVPYDRPATSMKAFPLCPQCQQEYDDPADRRFHAQPNACLNCGPRIRWCGSDGHDLAIDDMALDDAVLALKRGEILAIKGLGGFHLAVDATNATAVQRLRQRKRRLSKPFALMVPTLACARRYVQISAEETELLQGLAAPIVLLDRQHQGRALAPEVAPGQPCLGVMLPSNPLQLLLMAAFAGPLVMTSGNASGRPPCIDDAVALAELGPIVDGFLTHDRAIVNRADDSIARVVDGEVQLLRRARGYVPEPIPLPLGLERADQILAYGADLKNTFAYVKQGKVLLSQHLGDLDDPDLFQAYQDNIALFGRLFDVRPTHRICDAHSGYHSHRLARQEATTLTVPHHHAHLASGLVDNGWRPEDGDVLAWVLDGTGMGDGSTEHALWGGELLLGDYQRCQRLTGLPAVALPGGDLAARQPWRNLLAHLERFAPHWQTLTLPVLRQLESKPLLMLRQAIARGMQSPPASSSGRLFDAIAALLGLNFEQIHFEGEAAMALEALAGQISPRHLPAQSAKPEPELTALWHTLLDGLAAGREPADLAYLFHAQLASELVAVARYHAEQHDCRTVLLSGGVMQNRLLQTLLRLQLNEVGLTPLFHRRIPANDGGIAVGQAAIAAARLRHVCYQS
ncbi:carbamoyltransferase HypF [Ferrimonas pelagia]|uniref:Carbamoyltransferase HypF n=1 Tax=Ferrimonas pelagia TaxID=1177826 RepID=A0ABP9ELG7_9GAMM